MRVWLEGKVKRKRKGGKSKKCWRGVWDEKDRKKFKQEVGRLEIEGRKLEDWKIVEGKVKKALEEIERERGKEKEKKRGWWDEKCEVKKREVRKELRDWRRKERDGEKYKRGKHELCKERKREENLIGKK